MKVLPSPKSALLSLTALLLTLVLESATTAAENTLTEAEQRGVKAIDALNNRLDRIGERQLLVVVRVDPHFLAVGPSVPQVLIHQRVDLFAVQ